MITKNLRFTLSVISIFSIVFVASTGINAAPVRFSQVTQVVDAKPGKANSGNYTRIRLANDPVNDPVNDPKKDNDNSGIKPPQQDDRVITETTFEVVEASECNCIQDEKENGFPYWTLLGLAAIPIAIVLIRDDDDKKKKKKRKRRKKHTPTPPPPTMTPTPPPKTPTPTPPEPVPEPMTILLFGTGLAGVGLAARRRFGRKEEGEEGEE